MLLRVAEKKLAVETFICNDFLALALNLLTFFLLCQLTLYSHIIKLSFNALKNSGLF